jgi:hypothetical protein
VRIELSSNFVLLQLRSRERCERFFLGWGMQDAARGKVLGLWVCSAANAVGGSGKIVASAPEVNIGAEQQPIGTRFSERHADAARVHDSRRADHPIKLHVGMAADDQRGAEPFKDGPKAVIWREAGKDVSVVARCGVAEKHVAEAENLDMACWRPAF